MKDEFNEVNDRLDATNGRLGALERWRRSSPAAGLILSGIAH